MKLSTIVHYRNQLDTMSVDRIRGQAEHELAAINHMVASQGHDIGFYKTRIAEQLGAVNESFEQFAKVYNSLKTELDSAIQSQQAAYYQESTRLYNQEMRYDTPEYLLSRKLAIDPDSHVILSTRLRNYTDWRTPGMIIRPGQEPFIEELVPLDPLYVVDQAQELIDPAVMSFNETYRARLRQYVIDEKDVKILGRIPNNQFGLIFAYNYFNFKPMELIERYLAELYEKLRSGGTLIMTYNDCDQAHGVELAERSFMCYTPKSQIVKIAESVGFDVTYQHTGLADLAWLELRRPGEIVSLRGGQTLARIVARSK
jgi:hypothetical protein